MSSKITWIRAFNTKFNEFMTDLVRTFPEDGDFRTFKQSVTLLQSVDERQLQKLWAQYVPAYREQILRKDEAFFMEQDFEHIQDEDVTAEVIGKLKGYWRELDADNRESIWKYLHLLITIGDKIAAL